MPVFLCVKSPSIIENKVFIYFVLYTLADYFPTMKCFRFLLLIIFVFASLQSVFSQEDSIARAKKDSINISALAEYNKKLVLIENQRLIDSLTKVELETEIKALKTTDNLKKEELQAQLLKINANEIQRISEKKLRIDSLKKFTTGFPVQGFFSDTLFFLYSNLGSFSPKERAEALNKRIENLGTVKDFDANSLKLQDAETSMDIIFGENTMMSVTENDALWNDSSKEALAESYKNKITEAVIFYKSETNFLNIAKKVGLAILVLVLIVGLIKYISKFFEWNANKIQQEENKKIKGIQIKNYTLFDSRRQVDALLFANRILKWIIILLAIYIALPILFGIFPWTEHFASTLFGYILNPLKRMLSSFWNYLPDLVTIIVILFVFRYIQRGIRYLKLEVARGNLVINGFYRDWAEPTYQIIRVLLIAFMVVVIWPYLPGSDSPIFKGVSVFLGFLFTFGSAGSLSNVMAGLVLTYMRLFTIGDRVKIGDVSGDVIEKTLLVTRIRTAQNEIISVPNSSVMNNHTINYSSDALEKGLIIHTKVTIGYDIPWKDVHDALIEAAERTELVLKDPKPFVLQIALEDFFVTYEIHAYIHEANRQGSIYSWLHENIQDVFNERNIEIMSPHYLAQRDGNDSTVQSKRNEQGK